MLLLVYKMGVRDRTTAAVFDILCAATMSTWEVLTISTKCGNTKVWDELAGIGGGASSGGFSTSASSMRM